MSSIPVKQFAISETQVAAAKVQMEKISELFSDEENKHLSYLGSMLRREPTEQEKQLDIMFGQYRSPERPDQRHRRRTSRKRKTTSGFLRCSSLAPDRMGRRGQALQVFMGEGAQIKHRLVSFRIRL